MPNPEITYEEYLMMFGTQEQKDKWTEQREFWDKWIEQNIPVYKPEGNFIIGGKNERPR